MLMDARGLMSLADFWRWLIQVVSCGRVYRPYNRVFGNITGALTVVLNVNLALDTQWAESKLEWSLGKCRIVQNGYISP